MSEMLQKSVNLEPEAMSALHGCASISPMRFRIPLINILHRL